MTETDICNRALGRLGHDREIQTDFRTDASTEALRCRLHFDASRRRVLSCGTPWPFALEAAPVSGHCGGGRPCGAPHGAALPADCLTVIGPAVRGTACGPAGGEPLLYVRDEADVEAWPAPALDALEAELAARLAGALTGSAERAAAARRDAAAALAAATLWAARQEPRAGEAGPDRYRRARGGGL